MEVTKVIFSKKQSRYRGKIGSFDSAQDVVTICVREDVTLSGVEVSILNLLSMNFSGKIECMIFT